MISRKELHRAGVLTAAALFTACGGGIATCEGAQGCVGESPQNPPRQGNPEDPASEAPSSPTTPAVGTIGESGDCAPRDGGACCDGGFSYSACSSVARYVRPGGGGNRDGSDWANAFDELPTELERDTVYWLGAGDYGDYTFNDDESGQAGITVRKATAAAHGTDAGWNAAYGSGQAVFGSLRFETGRYDLDGGEPNGLKAVGQMGDKATVHVGGNRIVLRHVEVDGGLEKSNGVQTAGSCNGGEVHGDYVLVDRCEIHNVADDGLGVYSADHVKIQYSKIHDLHACGTDASCSGPCYNGHSDGMELSDITDLELVGNMVYDVRSTSAIFMDNWTGSRIYDLVAYNNIFYTPDASFAVYLHALEGARLYNNIIWGRTQGNRYGGLAMGTKVTNLEMFNNIILNINYSHMGANQSQAEHRLDYNLFGMINEGEYQANANDLIADPQFAGIPMSGDTAEHKGSNLTLEDFVPSASAAIDTGITPDDLPAFDIEGHTRPSGDGWDRGPFEVM